MNKNYDFIWGMNIIHITEEQRKELLNLITPFLTKYCNGKSESPEVNFELIGTFPIKETKSE